MEDLSVTLYIFVQVKEPGKEKEQPVTETIKASEARQQWSTLLNEIFRGEKRVVVEKNGIPVAAILSPKDLNRLEQYDRLRRDRLRILEEVGEMFKGVPDEELESKVAQAVMEAREQQRRADQQRAELAQVLERMREPFKDMEPEEIEREVAKAIQEVRQER